MVQRDAISGASGLPTSLIGRFRPNESMPLDGDLSSVKYFSDSSSLSVRSCSMLVVTSRRRITRAISSIDFSRAELLFRWECSFVRESPESSFHPVAWVTALLFVYSRTMASSPMFFHHLIKNVTRQRSRTCWRRHPPYSIVWINSVPHVRRSRRLHPSSRQMNSIRNVWRSSKPCNKRTMPSFRAMNVDRSFFNNHRWKDSRSDALFVAPLIIKVSLEATNETRSSRWLSMCWSVWFF